MKIKAEDTAALIIDFQEKLVPAIADHDEIVAKAAIFAAGLKEFGVPMVVTQQYTKGLGHTLPSLYEAAGTTEYCEKASFSCCRNKAILDKLESMGKKNILVMGTEAHICVLQSCIDLKAAGFQPVMVVDAVASRREADKKIAIERAIQEGIFSDLSGQVRYSTQKRVLVEVALIKLCHPAMERNLDAVLNRLAILEQKVAKGVVVSSQSSGGGAAGGDADGISGLQSGNGVQVQPEQKAVSEDLRMIIDRWKQVTGDLTPSMAVMLRGAVISEGPDNQLIIALADDMRYGYFAEESHRQALENALSERVGKLVKVNAVPLNKTENASQFIDPVQAFQGIDIVYED